MLRLGQDAREAAPLPPIQIPDTRLGDNAFAANGLSLQRVGCHVYENGHLDGKHRKGVD